MTTQGNEDGEGRLPLAEVLSEVAKSFRKAKQAANAHEDGPVMGWSHAELELDVAFTREAGGSLKAWVVEAGGKGSKSEAVRLTVSLSPWAEDMAPSGGGGR